MNLSISVEQRWVLQVAYEVFRDSGRWPVMEAIDRLVDTRWDFDAYAAVQSLGPDLGVFDRIHLREDSEVKLRVRAISTCDGSAADLDLFLRAVRWLVEKERAHWPNTPHTAEQLRVTSEQFTMDLAGEGVSMDPIGCSKIYSLAEIERLSWGGAYGIAGDPGRWEINLNRNIRPFRRVETLEDFLAIRGRLDSEDGSAVAQATRPPATNLDEIVEAHDDRPFVFIAMPFESPWSEAVHKCIERCCQHVADKGIALRWQRADQIDEPGRITEQIRDALTSADVVIADISELNANVVYELGYADANQTALIVLSQDPGGSPFDLKDIRQIEYSVEDLGGIEKTLCRHLQAALETPGSPSASLDLGHVGGDVG